MDLNSFSMFPGRPERACWLSHAANIISIIHIMKLTNEKQLKLIKPLFSFTFFVLFCSFIFQFNSIQILFYSNAFGETNRIIIRRRGRWMVSRMGHMIMMEVKRIKIGEEYNVCDENGKVWERSMIGLEFSAILCCRKADWFWWSCGRMYESGRGRIGLKRSPSLQTLEGFITA